jgi:hypothetical protein
MSTPRSHAQRTPPYCMDETKYQIAIAIKTIAGITPVSFIRLFAKLNFFSSFFVFLTGTAVRLMVHLFDMVIVSFSMAFGTDVSLHTRLPTCHHSGP